MVEIKELLAGAYEAFDRAMASVPSGGWAVPTPCAAWDLKALVNHVVAEDLWVPPLLAGATMEEVGDAYDGDVVGDDPLAAWRSASREALAAWHEVPLDRVVHTSIRDFPAEEYGWQIFTDHLIHTWDVAVSVGADSRLAPGLVEACARWFDDWEDMYLEFDVIAQPVPVAEGADAQTRLLARFGRDATA